MKTKTVSDWLECPDCGMAMHVKHTRKITQDCTVVQSSIMVVCLNCGNVVLQSPLEL
jgi:uncharacterized Zn finger protein